MFFLHMNRALLLSSSMAILLSLAVSHAAKPVVSGPPPVEQAATPPVPELPAVAQFDIAYNYLRSADEALHEGKLKEAVTLYGEALEKYGQLLRRFPDWQRDIVQYRMQYCRQQLQDLKTMGKADAPGDTVRKPTKEPRAPDQESDRARENATRAESSRTLRLQSVALLRKGQTADAKSLLMEALKENPDDEAVRQLMAVAQCQSGAYEDAKFILTPLIEEYPTNALNHILMAVALLGLGRQEESLDETASALTLDEQSFAAHFNMAQILAHQDPPDLENAKSHYIRALALGAAPDPDMEKRLSNATENPDPATSIERAMRLDAAPAPQ